MKKIYKKDNEEYFWQKWQEYIENNDCVSFRYLPSYTEYMLYCSNILYADLSFVVIEYNKCVGICFLPIEKNEIFTITLANNYTIAPIFSYEIVGKFIFETIDEIAKNYNIKFIKFYLDPLISVYKKSYDFLLKNGFINTSSTDCLVDLRKDKTELWKNIRKSYKPIINGIFKDKNFEIILMNKDNPDYELHENYRELHYKCAGRITRKKETFDLQFKILKEGFATLIGLKYKEKFIGMQYFFNYKKTVVYASGADDPEYTHKKFNIYHPLLWKAQEYFQYNGFEFLQYSQPCGYNKVQGFDDYLDEKQLNISFFKKGMGAQIETLYRGVKYYDKILFLNHIENFREKAKNKD